MKNIFRMIVTAVVASTATLSHATTWELDFTGFYEAYDNGANEQQSFLHAIVTTEDNLSPSLSGAVLGYRILGMTGERNGVQITNVDLVDSFNFDGPMAWPNEPYLRPNLGDFNLLSEWGFAYQTADGIWYNVNGFGDSNGNNASERKRDPSNPDGLFIVQVGIASVTELSPSAVPEPATWMMMAGGLVVAGVARRRLTRAG